MAQIFDLRPITPRSNKTRNLNSIKNIARHHSATTSGDWEHFWNYWKGKGWGTGGYHEIILLDGSVQLCYDANEITNGIANHNSTTYHICVVGNGSFTAAQEKTWEERVLFNLKRFDLKVKDVLGHREFSGANTACPGIDMGMVRNRIRYLQSNTSEGEQELNYLKTGDTGEAVKALQGNLIKVGSKLSVDGSFGPATESALKAYQKSKGLAPDGFYGPATRQALENDVKPKAAPVKEPTEAATPQKPDGSELLSLTTQEGKNALLRVLKRFEKKDQPIAELWRQKVLDGTFTQNDSHELLWVAIDRGYISGKPE